MSTTPLTPLEVDDKELDVFDAEKYFNEADHIPSEVHLPTTHRRTRKDDPALEIFSIKEPPLPSTARTSLGSHSSLNSRSSLLQSASRNQRRHQQPDDKKPNKKSTILAAIGCKCSCADWSSIRTNNRFVKKQQTLDQPKTQPEGDLVSKRSKPLQAGKNEKMRSFAVMSWEEDQMKIPSISSEIRADGDGSESDSSSDLFEIESLTRGGRAHGSNPFRSMQTTSDGCKSPACYAPSEASVEWSVVTASAADFSMVSDSEELTRPKKNTGMNMRTSGLLSGCMSQKALRVNTEHGERNLRTDDLTTKARDEGEFGVRNRQRSPLEARVFFR